MKLPPPRKRRPSPPPHQAMPPSATARHQPAPPAGPAIREICSCLICVPLPGRCVLCGGKAEYRLAYFPTRTFARRIGFPPGQGEALPLGLCRKHYKKMPGIVPEVEAAMLAAAESRAASN